MQKTVKKLKEKQLSGNGLIDRIFMILKIKLTQGFSCPCPGAIHMYMYMTIIVKRVKLYCYISQISGERVQDHCSSGSLLPIISLRDACIAT